MLVDRGGQEGGGGGRSLESRPLGRAFSGSFVFGRLGAGEKSSYLLLLLLFFQLHLQVCRDMSGLTVRAESTTRMHSFSAGQIFTRLQRARSYIDL